MWLFPNLVCYESLNWSPGVCALIGEYWFNTEILLCGVHTTFLFALEETNDWRWACLLHKQGYITLFFAAFFNFSCMWLNVSCYNCTVFLNGPCLTKMNLIHTQKQLLIAYKYNYAHGIFFFGNLYGTGCSRKRREDAPNCLTNRQLI